MKRLVMSAVALLVVAGSATAMPPTFTFGTGQLNEPDGVAVAPSGDVYVADRDNNRVVRFSHDGSLLNAWAEGSLTWGVAADQTGIYTASQTGVSKRSSDGTLLWSAAVQAVHLTSDGNHVYVSDMNNPGSIRVLDAATGALLATWNMPSGVNGGLAPRPGGGLYVYDWIGYRIAVVDASGGVVRTLVTPPSRAGNDELAADQDGNVYTETRHCDDGGWIYAYSPLGSVLGTFPKAIPAGSAECDIAGMAYSEDGRLYVAQNTLDRVKVYDLWTPDTALVASTDRPLTGTPVTFTATATVGVGTITGYEGDLDGDGSFETTTSAPTAATTYTTAGSRTVRMRATSSHGNSSTESVDVTVFTAPPAGEPGISINHASPYTNDKSVALSVVWPPFATGMRISNDGGFTGATTVQRDLAATQPWALDDSVKALYTKVVYVRFSGSGIDETKTYSDDIILDLTPPKITDASAVAGSGANEMAVGSAVRVRVRAKDNRSGVRWMQVTPSKSRPGTAIKFTARKTVPLGGKRIFIRVQDGAGNWSPWRTVPVR